jgi:UDP-glucuronate 4-epimerase
MSHLIKKLKEDSDLSHKVIIFGGEGFVGKHMRKSIDGYVYDLVNGDDIRDRFKLDRLFESEGFDTVINLAARAGVRRGEDFPEEYFSTNVIGLNNLIEVSEKYGVKKFVHFSSSSVFGVQGENGTKEDEEKKPKSIYGITKLAGELLLEKSRLDYVIVRPFTIVGENGRKEMVVYKWLNQIKSGKKASFYGDGTTYRGYTYVEDIVDAVRLILANKSVKRETFNIGGNSIVTLEELWHVFKEIYPHAEREMLPMPVTDQVGSFADTSKLKDIIGWFPRTDVKQKIKEIITEEL